LKRKRAESVSAEGIGRRFLTAMAPLMRVEVLEAHKPPEGLTEAPEFELEEATIRELQDE